MPVIVTDSDDISSIHTAERLEINLAIAKETVEDMTLKIYFNVETKLGKKSIGQPYWDSTPLELTCKDNPELAEAMQVIQRAIGHYRYLQLTTPPENPEIAMAVSPID